MSLIIKVPDIPSDGLVIDQLVEAADLDLSSDEGEVRGGLRCSGTLIKPDGATVYFRGRLEGKIARECVRCLGSFEEDVIFRCSLLFKKPAHEIPSAVSRMPGKDRDLSSDEGDETYPIVGNQIDLIPVFREQIILATPLRALCREQCAGLCQVCGANLNADVCDCRSPVMASEGGLHPAPSMFKPNASLPSQGGHRRGHMKKHKP